MDETEFEFGVTPFYFVRHGETIGNELGIVQGQTETDLSALGRNTAVRAAEQLSKVPLGSIYASPLKRAMTTASIVRMFNGAPVIPLRGLMERHWGGFQGRPKGLRPPIPSPRGVESIEEFESRVLTALRSITGPSPVLVVAHSGVFRVICRLAGLPADSSVSVANGQALRLEPPAGTKRTWRIRAV